MQIDKHAGAQQPVDLIFPTAVTAHQPFQRAWLISREVVDMHGGVLLKVPDRQIYKPLECLAFFLGGKAPSGHISWMALFIVSYDAEQIFSSAPCGKGVALQIKEQISARRLRQLMEAVIFIQCQKL